MKSYYLRFFVSNILFCRSTPGFGVFYAGKSFKRPAINSALQSESLRLESKQLERQLERQLESLPALGSTIFRLFIV